MSKESVQYCTEADLPELFRCFAGWYRFNPRLQEREYFDWQFKHAPIRLGAGDYDFLLLRRKGNIVGCLGFVGFEFKHAGRVDVGGWTHNWFAQDQGEGALSLLGSFMDLTDNRFVVRFNENTARVFSLLKVPMISAIPRSWAAIDARAAARLFEFDSQDMAALQRSETALRAVDGKGCIQQVDRFDATEEFSLSHFGENVAHARRNGRYLNWRYFDIPGHNYQAIRTEDQFAVFRVEPIMGTQESVIRIVEWTFSAVNAPHALAWILSNTEGQRPVVADFHSMCPPVARTLEPLGFLHQSATAKPMPDLFRPTNYSGGYSVAIDLPPHRLARTVEFDRWYITIGDSDIDRIKL